MNHSADEGRAAPKGLRRRMLDRVRLPWRDDSGLTLLEMLAVILVVAILATGGFIAIQRIRGGAQSSVAKTNLSTAVTALVTAHGVQQDGQLPASATLADHLNAFVEDLTVVAYDGTGVATGYQGWQWATNGPAANEVFVATNDTAINDANSPGTWSIAPRDAVWLITKAEDGDTYCTLVVLEISGDTEKGGTRYDAALSDSPIATCGLGSQTAAAAAADVLTDAAATNGLVNTDPDGTTAVGSATAAGLPAAATFSASIPDAN